MGTLYSTLVKIVFSETEFSPFSIFALWPAATVPHTSV
jgi:hypothetical protein